MSCWQATNWHPAVLNFWKGKKLKNPAFIDLEEGSRKG